MTSPPTGPLTEHDADAWQILSPLLVHGGYLPWTTGSMRPAGLVKVCNEIVRGDRTRILECGSGVSTVLLARLLHERERGVLTSLEHDPHWATLIQDHLQREHLDQIARVVHAPLQGDPPWYRLDDARRDRLADRRWAPGVRVWPRRGARAGACPTRRQARPRRSSHSRRHRAPRRAADHRDLGDLHQLAFQLNLPADVAIGQRQTEPPSP